MKKFYSCEVELLGFSFDKYYELYYENKQQRLKAYPVMVDGIGWANWVHEMQFTPVHIMVLTHYKYLGYKMFNIHYHVYGNKQYVDNVIPIGKKTQDMALENPKF